MDVYIPHVENDPTCEHRINDVLYANIVGCQSKSEKRKKVHTNGTRRIHKSKYEVCRSACCESKVHNMALTGNTAAIIRFETLRTAEIS
jgi:hypothetical protein